MVVRKLELIREERGKWIRDSDGSCVDPSPRGRPISDTTYTFEDPYRVVKKHAKRQKLWDNGANAYSVEVSEHWIFNAIERKGMLLLAAQLYDI